MENWIYKSVIDGETGTVIRDAKDQLDGECLLDDGTLLLKVNGRICGKITPDRQAIEFPPISWQYVHLK